MVFFKLVNSSTYHVDVISISSQASFGMAFNAWIVLLASWTWLFRRHKRHVSGQISSRTHATDFLQMVVEEGKSLISGKSRLVKYYEPFGQQDLMDGCLRDVLNEYYGVQL